MLNWRLFAVVVCVTAAACGAQRAARAQAPSTSAVSQHELQSAGASRSYLLSYPDGESADVPLVIALHGGGGNAETMVPRWLPLAQRERFAVAFPNGLGRVARMGTWNAAGCCGYAMTSNSDDVAFIAAVIEDVSRTHRIDTRRIYVTGLSNGGMLTYRVAEMLGPRIAAAAVVSGAMFGDEPTVATPVPILIMHGAQDEIVPFAGGLSPMALVARSQSRPFRPVSYAVDYWRRENGCAQAANVVTNGDVRVETSDCRDGSEVVFYRLASAGHTWPGRSSEAAAVAIERAPYTEIDGSEVIWEFFSRHAR